MKTITKSIWKLMAVFSLLPLWGGNVLAQTKTENEAIPISTGHASFTAIAKKNGTALEVWVYNNSSTKYTVGFTADITLRGGKGDFTKTVRYSGTIAPNKSDYTSPIMIGWANATTNMYNSLSEGVINNFNATPVETENSTTSSNHTSSSNNSSAPSTSTTTTSSTETRYNTNPQIKDAVERQNRLNELQKQQQERKQAAKEFMDKNQRDYVEQQKQQQKTTQDVLAIGGAIRDLFAEKAAREDAEEARKKAYKLRMENEARNRKEVLETKISNRKAVIAEFPAKDIPLSSQEKSLSIYYFIYAYDNTINNEYGATVYISNVFEIGQYNDGTRAYTATVKNEITTLSPFTETLHGYYYTRQEAEQLRQTLISILKNNGVSISEVAYKGKPTAKSTITENATTNTNQLKYGKTISTGGSKSEQNLAPAKINTAKPSELPREAQKKENGKYGKTIKID